MQFHPLQMHRARVTLGSAPRTGPPLRCETSSAGVGLGTPQRPARPGLPGSPQVHLVLEGPPLHPMLLTNMCAPPWAHCLCGDEAGPRGGGRWVTKQTGGGAGSRVLPESGRMLVLTACGLGARTASAVRVGPGRDCSQVRAHPPGKPRPGVPHAEPGGGGGPSPDRKQRGAGKGGPAGENPVSTGWGRSDGEGRSEALACRPARPWVGVHRVCTGRSPGTARCPAFYFPEAPWPGLSEGPCPVGALRPGRVTSAPWFAHRGPRGSTHFCRPGCGEGPAGCCWPPNPGPPWGRLCPQLGGRQTA